MRVLAVIPARAGSKGVPGKNHKVIAGKPLISYTIECALESEKLAKVLVSSDSADVLNIAKGYDRVYIHTREKDLATDSSPIQATLLEILRNENEEFDALMLLQPTSPIRESKHINEAIALLSENEEANSVISVVAMDDIHPARMYWKERDRLLSPILTEYEQSMRQQIPPAYYRNGSIYLARKEALLRSGSVMVKPTLGYEMPADMLLNIDGPRDLIIAEPLIQAWKEKRF